MKIDHEYTLVDGSRICSTKWLRSNKRIKAPTVVRKRGVEGFFIVLPDYTLLSFVSLPRRYDSYNAAKRVADTLPYVTATGSGSRVTHV